MRPETRSKIARDSGPPSVLSMSRGASPAVPSVSSDLPALSVHQAFHPMSYSRPSSYRRSSPLGGVPGARSKTIADGPDRVLENTRGQPRRRPPPSGPPGEE